MSGENMGVVVEPPARELIERGRAGDLEALGALYDLLAPEVQRCLVALRLGLGPAEVEDAVQETFLRLFRALERVDPARPVKAYALGIARHVGQDLARRRAAAREDGELDPDQRADSDAGQVGEAIERGEQQALVRAALGALSPEQREVLALRHQARLTMESLAEALGCSVPTARSRLREAARRFGIELRARGVISEGAKGGAA